MAGEELKPCPFCGRAEDARGSVGQDLPAPERAALEWVRGIATQWEAIGVARSMANLTGTDDLNYSNSAAHLRVVLRMAEGSSEGPPSHEVASTNHDQ